MSRTEIFKLQRPIVQFGKPPIEPGSIDVLAYNEDRSIQGQFPMSLIDAKTIFGDEYMVYVRGRWRKKDGQILVSEVVEDQPW